MHITQSYRNIYEICATEMPELYCRFCAELKPAQEVINFIKPMHNEIREKIILIKIDFVDFTDKIMPGIICNSCLSILNTFYSFLLKAKSSQDVLRNIFSHQALIDNDSISEHFADDSNIIHEDCLYRMNDVSQKQTLDFVSSPWASYSWLCGHCHLKFNSLASVRSHYLVDHGVCNGWKCPDCLERIDEYEQFIIHTRTHNSEMHYCELCNMKLENGHTHTPMNKPRCKYCGEMFETAQLLSIHLNKYQNEKITSTQISLEKQCIESWSTYKWTCKHCDMVLSSQEMLRNHSKIVHGKCFGMKCADCDINLTNFIQFVDHVRKHRENLRYYCPYCDIPITDETHIKQHTTDFISCRSCGKLFQNETDFREHIRSVKETEIEIKHKKKHSKRFKKMEKPITEEDLICNFCGKRTKNLKSLRLHIKRHSERNRNYTCDRCGKTFLTKSTLSAHIIIHEKRDPEVCKICKKTFLTLTRLKKHVKTHYNERPFRCEVCHKCFRLKEHLKSHAVIHTDEMPYHCQYCEKTFKHRNVLKTHENQHTGARPYSCDICDMYFANWSNCNKHLKRKHGTTLAKNVITPQGKLPINPKTGKPKKLKDLETVRDWTESIMGSKKRGWSESKSVE